ncbi:hypothetical protein D3C87_2159440 [compost metagenome]
MTETRRFRPVDTFGARYSYFSSLLSFRFSASRSASHQTVCAAHGVKSIFGSVRVLVRPLNTP